MQHESYKENDLTIESTDKNFYYWLNQQFISSKLKKELEEAEILLVPQIGFREQSDPVFPIKTEELFTFLKKKNTNGKKVDICIENNDYKEIALHSDLLTIVTFVVTTVALPILVNLLSDYIKNKIIKENSDRAIKISLIVQNENGASKKVTYEGKPENFDDTIKSIENIWKK